MFRLYFCTQVLQLNAVVKNDANLVLLKQLFEYYTVNLVIDELSADNVGEMLVAGIFHTFHCVSLWNICSS